ncbi:VOC family protein [Sandaracinobacter sp.]|mgnify:CR=1 FL=1|jgi:catechol 2,3-dioxygenase-like lactoylglutathione lyase family enzyme|uniref:VOC family protein n=1 Tax=Sandaracinobacter sp. TaxID=2487581 RepID=UPI0035B3F576
MSNELKGIHHSAFRCRDATETRAFYEGVLGLPVAAALFIEQEPSSGKAHPYVHIFFELPDGNYIAFFDAPSSARPEHFQKAHGFDRHVAFEADSIDKLHEWKDRLEAQNVPVVGPVDHHFVQSIYMYDPNGLQVEITARTDRHDPIMAHEKGQSEAILADWTARTVAEKAKLYA